MADITVYVTSDLTSSERRVSPQWSLAHLKERLELITGVAPQFQTIHLYKTPDSNEYCTVSSAQNPAKDDDKFVANLGLIPFCRLHVINEDSDSVLDKLQDNTFQLSEEEYAKRNATVLQWKKENSLGRFSDEYEKKKQEEQQKNSKASEDVEVGTRCRVINIAGERRGAVRFVGKINSLDEGESLWVGIEFDEPVGRNNGTIDGVKYFECKNKHGSFVKAQKVEVGDFPEINEFEDIDEL